MATKTQPERRYVFWMKYAGAEHVYHHNLTEGQAKYRYARVRKHLRHNGRDLTSAGFAVESR